jgi:hypothetical protein
MKDLEIWQEILFRVRGGKLAKQFWYGERQRPKLLPYRSVFKMLKWQQNGVLAERERN